MSNEELVALIQAGVDVKENMGILYQQNEGLIMKWAYPYSGTIDLEDLMQEAYFGLVAAVEGFDPEKEFKFTTYAYWKILQKIVRYSGNNRHMKRIPVHMLNLMSKYHKFKRSYLDEIGEKPTESEYMEHLEINKRQFKELEKQIAEINCLNLESPMSNKVADGKTIAETLSDNFDLELDVVERLTYNQLATGIWKAVDDLEERQREIVIERYKHQRTLEQIGLDKDLSEQRIEQIEKKALRLLSMNQELNELADMYGYECGKCYKYGVQRFKDTMTSSTELVALRNIEIQEGLDKVNYLLENIVNL